MIRWHREHCREVTQANTECSILGRGPEEMTMAYQMFHRGDEEVYRRLLGYSREELERLAKQGVI